MEYLVNRKKGRKKKRAHRWTGADTACRMWSTGGITQKKKWVVENTTCGLEVCLLCIKKAKEEDIKTDKVSKKRGAAATNARRTTPENPGKERAGETGDQLRIELSEREKVISRLADYSDRVPQGEQRFALSLVDYFRRKG